MHQIWKCPKNILKLIAIETIFFCCTQLCTVRSYGTEYSKHQTLHNESVEGGGGGVIYVYYHI